VAKSKKPASKVTTASFLKDAVLARLDDPEGKEAYPLLFEALAPVFDGQVLTRQPGKMTIRVEGASWQVTLDFPTEVLQTRLYAPSLHDLLAKVEEFLRSGTLVFTPGWKKSKKPLPTIDDPLASY